MKPHSRVLSFGIGAVLLLSTQGCLKSRLQVRGDDNEATDSKPVPVQVQDAEPKPSYAIEEMKGEFTRLEGRVEDLERAKSGADSSVKPDDYKKLEARVTELEQAQAKMLEAITQMQAGAKAAASAAEENPGGAFDKAKAAFKSGDFDTAIDDLTAYLKTPKPKYAEEATFLRAESYFATKQYKKAIVDYSRFPEKYTKSKHIAAALFKIGRSFDALGMMEDARGFYQELVDKHPKSPEAKKARSHLH